MIKGIFFDFDGVLTMEKMGTPTMVSYISDKTGLAFEAVDAAYRKHNSRLLMGEITHMDMWEEMCADLGRNIDYRILVESFLNMTIDERMVKFIGEHKDNYLIGMITDNKVDRIETMLNKTGLGDFFDTVIISGAVHGRKKGEAIFEEALFKSGLEPYECIFIDNTEANLVIPDGMGIKTVFFDDEVRDYDKFEKEVADIIESNSEVEIETKRLILRRMNEGDYEALYKVLADPEIMQHYPYEFDEARIRGWIARNIERYKMFGFGLWAVCLKDSREMIGDCGITMQLIGGVIKPEIGYHIRHDMQRKGFAREAAMAVRDWTFENTPFEEIYSYMKYTNEPSARSAMSWGCTFVEEFEDEVNERTRVYCISRSQWNEMI